MEQTKPGAAGIAFKWAIFNVIVGILITVLLQATGIDQNGPVKYISFIPLILFLYLSQNEWKKRNGGFMTYGEGFVEGLLFAVFAAILGAIFTYIYLAFINPHLIEQAIAAKHDEFVQQGLSEDQIEKAGDIGRRLGAPIGAVAALFMTVIITGIIALITAAILKNERTIRDIENQHSDPAV